MFNRPMYPASGSTEPDMRQEFKNTLDGHYPEVSKSQISLFRKMRRDSKGKLIKCPCVDAVTDEPDIDVFCPVCHGEGNLWDESYLDTYKVVTRSEAIYGAPIIVIYCKSSLDITSDDRIVELVLDEEGKAVKPIKRKILYEINEAIDFRADNGRREYWKLDCHEKAYKFLNGI